LCAACSIPPGTVLPSSILSIYCYEGSCVHQGLSGSALRHVDSLHVACWNRSSSSGCVHRVIGRLSIWLTRCERSGQNSKDHRRDPYQCLIRLPQAAMPANRGPLTISGSFARSENCDKDFNSLSQTFRIHEELHHIRESTSMGVDPPAQQNAPELIRR
jgi:hypothetical protein